MNPTQRSLTRFLRSPLFRPHSTSATTFARGLLNKIHKEFGLANQSQTEQILNQGKVLILLDGLDEVPGQSRRDVQDHIYEFSQSQQHYKNRFILTCRTQTTEYVLPTFDCVEVADFNPEQVEIFAQNWFTALAETPEQGEELKAQFLTKLRFHQNKQTAELAVTPILLSLTCWVFNDLKDLPSKRFDLYEQGLDLLLKQWDEKRGVRRELGNELYRKLSVRQKKKLLSYVAVCKFNQQQYVLFKHSEIHGYIAEHLSISTEDSQAVLEGIEAQHGLLVQRAQNIWSFSHLTFQEYFTAQWFCNRADWQDLVKHITEEHWREVFLLTAGMMRNADELVQLMKQKIDALIAKDPTLQKFITWVHQKSVAVDGPYKLTGIRAFYFVRAFTRALVRADAFDRGFNLDRVFNHTSIFYRGFNCDRVFNHTYFLNLDLEITLNLALDLAHVLDLNHAYALKLALNLALDRTQNPEFQHKLQEVRDQLPDSSWDNQKNFQQWWQAYGQVWTEKLRAVMIEHRNIGHNWQFSEEQEECLRRYHDANEFLVKCLHSDCVVSDELREEIEETLLLPIDEIKKRQQQVQVTDVAGE